MYIGPNAYKCGSGGHEYIAVSTATNEILPRAKKFSSYATGWLSLYSWSVVRTCGRGPARNYLFFSLVQAAVYLAVWDIYASSINNIQLDGIGARTSEYNRTQQRARSGPRIGGRCASDKSPLSMVTIVQHCSEMDRCKRAACPLNLFSSSSAIRHASKVLRGMLYWKLCLLERKG